MKDEQKKEEKNKDQTLETGSQQPKCDIQEHAKLSEELQALQKEKADLFGQLQRLSADYANYQKRSIRQITDSVNYEKEMIIKSLLPAIDNFARTIENAEKAEDTAVVVKGVKIIYDQIMDILKSHNVEQIAALGEHFDPLHHQAIVMQNKPENKEGIILEEFQKGYKLNGRVIRPSRVAVNKLEEKQQTPENQQEDFDQEQ